ncbi:MAG: hypothetical protein C0602_05830 [Denitrovibrio sp.]|nr:MAG: hypothetical protein C0602_05830 [Denitrovibrio sp.]
MGYVILIGLLFITIIAWKILTNGDIGNAFIKEEITEAYRYNRGKSIFAKKPYKRYRNYALAKGAEDDFSETGARCVTFRDMIGNDDVVINIIESGYKEKAMIYTDNATHLADAFMRKINKI